MKKKLSALAALCLACAMLAGCSTSPSAVTVGNRRVDASEYAFYLNYNRLSLAEKYGYLSDGIYDDEITQTVKQDALDQIVTAEVIRLKCDEYGLELSAEQKKELKETKAGYIESLGGKAAYLSYLRENALTDRMYDKFQENTLYYDMLYDYVLDESKAQFNDTELRKYFGENYITVKYIRFSLIDEDGNTLGNEQTEALLEQANTVLGEAQAEGADFDALMAQYNDDPAMQSTPDGMVVSQLEASYFTYLAPAFELAENQIGGVYTASDGYYIVKREPVNPTYFEENQSDILQSAIEWNFTQRLEEWKAGVTVSTAKVVDKITLENLTEFVK